MNRKLLCVLAGVAITFGVPIVLFLLRISPGYDGFGEFLVDWPAILVAKLGMGAACVGEYPSPDREHCYGNAFMLARIYYPVVTLGIAWLIHFIWSHIWPISPERVASWKNT
jgi:hypothetical protein